MFIVHMPESFEVGDTAACRINGVPTQLTWLRPDLLIVGNNDARHIVLTDAANGVRVFFCNDADNSQYGVEEVPGGGFVVFREPKRRPS